MKCEFLKLIVISGLFASLITACGREITPGFTSTPQISSSPVKILFVCGGNTGRSPSAEALADANGMSAFSRASGLDPSDQLYLEQGALNALAAFAESQNKKSDYYTQYIAGRKAQQINYTDILRSSVVYPITEGHMCRVVLNIATNANSILEANQQFSKVHLLSSCATGKYTTVPDGFGVAESQEVKVYNGIIAQLNSYILAIKNNHGVCITPLENSNSESSLTETINYCCKNYAADLNKRYKQYCVKPR